MAHDKSLVKSEAMMNENRIKGNPMPKEDIAVNCKANVDHNPQANIMTKNDIEAKSENKTQRDEVDHNSENKIFCWMQDQC